MAESTTALREFLLETHGPVTLEKIAETFRNPAEPLAWLIAGGMVIQTPEGFVAKDGLGNPVKRGGVRYSEAAPHHVRTHGKDKGFRGHIITPKMSSRQKEALEARRRAKKQ